MFTAGQFARCPALNEPSAPALGQELRIDYFCASVVCRYAVNFVNLHFYSFQKGEVAAISEHFPFTKFFENAPQVSFKSHKTEFETKLLQLTLLNAKLTKLKIFSLLSVNFLDEYKFSSLVMGSNMDYCRSFRIKISHRDTYTRNLYIWRHRTNVMCTIIYFYC